MNLTPSRVGEVVEAKSTIFVTQCYKLYVTPPLGGFVRTGSPPTYGVVSLASTEPLDRARPIIARGEQAASEADIYRDNPQLAQLLTSRFESLILGYTQDGASHQFLPPLPPAGPFLCVCLHPVRSGGVHQPSGLYPSVAKRRNARCG